MGNYTWLLYALGGALCAALVSLLGKFGMKDVNPDMATAIRSVVQALFVVIFAVAMGVFKNVHQLQTRAGLSILGCGIAGGLSWILMFRALNLVDASKVLPIDKLSMPLAVLLAVIFLRERPIGINWVGIGLIVVGAFLASLKTGQGSTVLRSVGLHG